MKKIHFAGLILLTVLVATACSKKDDLAGIQQKPDSYNEAKIVTVKNTRVNVKLISAEGFDDPCFNKSLDYIPTGYFRFTGGHHLWTYNDLSNGVHTYSYSCYHTCDDDTENGTMVFQIDDGKTLQDIPAVKTGHCKYEFKIWVN